MPTEGYLHVPPTRQYVIDMVRARGARALYGATWPHSDGETLERLMAYPYEYLVAKGCDHHDDRGRCLGHPEADT
ncbi:MAG: hypothetical protein H0W08_24330 [Acidobacteria bacterium]|nr:hypothetical protein [Acidobacteriota bacterium]